MPIRSLPAKRTTRFPAIFIAACGILACFAGSASASGVTTSFTTGFEGWTFVNPSGSSWQSSGGNPGGYVRFDDLGPANGGQFLAPASYLGNWTSYDGVGSLSADAQLFVLPPQAFAFPSFSISGPGGSAFWTASVPSGPFGWTTFTAPITASQWSIRSGSWAAILANVTQLLIFMPASSVGGEITGIDNVTLVPAPGVGALLGLGGLLAARRRR